MRAFYEASPVAAAVPGFFPPPAAPQAGNVRQFDVEMSVLPTIRELSPNRYKMAGMTENPEEPIPTEESVVQNPSLFDHSQVDFLLQAIVDLANNTGIEMGITLCVGGTVLSGQLISGKAYFEEIANEALQASGSADAGVRLVLSEFLGNLGKSIYERTENEEESGKEVDRTMKRLPGFIHLRDAKFFHNSGQPMPGNRGIRWRGRLSAVDGFSLGVMSAR
jgi:hypothetical protein